ncbi:MAG: hypothetical protein MUC31_01725 [Bacteroidales bacterium]|nr:hypothetical protein [Bacteroidales bacterium]
MGLKMSPDAQKIFFKIIYRSSAFALIALFISLSLEKLLIIASAAIYGYSIGISYQEVAVIADPTSWDQESVLIIYLFPYMVQAIIIVLLYINMQKWKPDPNYFRILSLWIMFFILFRVLGMLPSHLISKTGIYHAFNWLYLGKTLVITISVVSMIIFFISGIALLKGILFFTATYNNHVKAIKLPNMIMAALLVPALVSCIISFLFYLPGLPENEMTGIAILALVFSYTIIRLLTGRPEQLPTGIFVREIFSPRQLFFIAFALIAIFRIVLGIFF